MPAYCPVFLLLPSYVLKYLDWKHNYLDEILPPPKTQKHQKSKIFCICQPRSEAKLSIPVLAFHVFNWRARTEFPVFYHGYFELEIILNDGM